MDQLRDETKTIDQTKVTVSIRELQTQKRKKVEIYENIKVVLFRGKYHVRGVYHHWKLCV